MEETNQKVPFTGENIKKCICTRCPVQSTSQCVKEKMEKAEEMMPTPEDLPGLYCATGAAACEDLDTRQMCICGDCPLWEEYELARGEPMGYYCRDGKAKQ
jgi:hypothetical protein